MAVLTAVNASVRDSKNAEDECEGAAFEAAATLRVDFSLTRQQTASLCAALETEDHVVQPASFVSPPKWHLAHTTWFFDRFVLQSDGRIDTDFPDRNLLFNSYYKSQGPHWLQESRGHLSRPTVRQISDYRFEVEERVLELIDSEALSPRQKEILALGIQHEKQHQELLLMDIKFIYAAHPYPPPYDAISRPLGDLSAPTALRWLEFPETVNQFGARKSGFSWDNEKPRHRRLMPAFQLSERMTSNGDYLAFMEDGGYQRPELWLSDGWDWINSNQITCPLYWRTVENSSASAQGTDSPWFEYHLGGLQPLQATLPVSHISYFEADAFARWSHARLPTEFELEHFLASQARAHRLSANSGWQPERAVCPLPSRSADSWGNGLLWQWTSSPYAPYPGFVPEAGALGEYNGKFMCNQLVLKGGCVATPLKHLRDTYRNFYRASDRWCFSGIRLAKDL